MSATEDESQSLDAGWDDEEPSQPGEDDVDQAWDSLPPPTSATVSAATPSVAPATEEVDSGLDDVPEGASQHAPGKRRPHRQRRAKTTAAAVSQNPVLMPRPAEPTKKHQREHARKQRAQEALARQQRKDEKKAQRAAEAREDAAARLRQTEAEALARSERLEEQKRKNAARPAKAARPKRAEVAKQSEKHSEKKTPSSSVELKQKEAVAHKSAPKSGLRPGVIVTLVVLAAVAVLLLLSK
jgi:colicin import membrane protein